MVVNLNPSQVDIYADQGIGMTKEQTCGVSVSGNCQSRGTVWAKKSGLVKRFVNRLAVRLSGIDRM